MLHDQSSELRRPLGLCPLISLAISEASVDDSWPTRRTRPQRSSLVKGRHHATSQRGRRCIQSKSGGETCGLAPLIQLCHRSGHPGTRRRHSDHQYDSFTSNVSIAGPRPRFEKSR